MRPSNISSRGATMMRNNNMLTLAALLVLCATTLSHPLPTLVHSSVQCSSSLMNGEGAYSAQITPAFDLHWKLDEKSELLQAIVDYKSASNAWVGLGFAGSDEGHMVGSKAVIGTNKDGVLLYEIQNKSASGIVALETNGDDLQGSLQITDEAGDQRRQLHSTNHNHNHHGGNHKGHNHKNDHHHHADQQSAAAVASSGTTELHLSLKLTPEITEEVDGLYTLLLAGGDKDSADESEVTYHRHRASFRINLRSPECGDKSATSTEEADAAAAAQAEKDKQEAEAEAEAREEAKAKADADAASKTAAAAAGAPQQYDHKAAFIAHGVLASLAFAICLPLSVAASWFRALMPAYWIYIHVLGNCLGFFLAMISVAVAFGAVLMRDGGITIGGSSVTMAHHWIGLLVFILVAIQVVFGLNRPAVERTKSVVASDASTAAAAVAVGSGSRRRSLHQPQQAPQPQVKTGIAKCCSCNVGTARERWYLIHRLLALLIVGLALFQLKSGIDLLSMQYLTASTGRVVLIVFWSWIGLLTVWCLGMGMFVWHLLEQRRRQEAAKSSRNIMPQRGEDIDASDHTHTGRSRCSDEASSCSSSSVGSGSVTGGAAAAADSNIVVPGGGGTAGVGDGEFVNVNVI